MGAATILQGKSSKNTNGDGFILNYRYPLQGIKLGCLDYSADLGGGATSQAQPLYTFDRLKKKKKKKKKKNPVLYQNSECFKIRLR